MNLRPLGWSRTLRGLREGNQLLLLSGFALVMAQRWRGSGRQRKLIYRKKLPVGSTIVLRHSRRGEPRVEILRRDADQTR